MKYSKILDYDLKQRYETSYQDSYNGYEEKPIEKNKSEMEWQSSDILLAGFNNE